MNAVGQVILLSSIGLIGATGLVGLGASGETLIARVSAESAQAPMVLRATPSDAGLQEYARSLGSTQQAAGALQKVVRATLKQGVRTTGKSGKRNRQIAKALEVVVLEGLENQPPSVVRRLERESAKRIDDATGAIETLNAEQFVDALERLGPGYQKLGQILSTRSDVMQPTFGEQLTRLTTDVKPPRDLQPWLTAEQLERYPEFDFEYAIDPRANQAIYGPRNGTRDPSRIFNRSGKVASSHELTLRRLGSGTVADVMVGTYTTRSGWIPQRPDTTTVLKQVRDGVPEALARDLAQIERAVGKLNKDAARLFAPMMEDLRRAVAVETDLRVEGEALTRAEKVLLDANAHVSELLPLGDEGHLFMTQARGEPVNKYFTETRKQLGPRTVNTGRSFQANGRTIQWAKTIEPSADAKRILAELDVEGAELADKITGDVLDMLLGGFLHGDLHGGNILYDSRTKVRTYLDWGLHAEVKPELLAGIVDLQAKIHGGKALEVARSLYRFEMSPSKIKRLALRSAIADVLVGDGTDVQKLAGVIAVGRSHGLNLPSDLGLIGKSLYQVEGTLEQISPGFDFAASIKRQMPLKLLQRAMQNQDLQN